MSKPCQEAPSWGTQYNDYWTYTREDGKTFKVYPDCTEVIIGGQSTNEPPSPLETVWENTTQNLAKIATEVPKAIGKVIQDIVPDFLKDAIPTILIAVAVVAGAIIVLKIKK